MFINTFLFVFLSILIINEAKKEENYPVFTCDQSTCYNTIVLSNSLNSSSAISKLYIEIDENQQLNAQNLKLCQSFINKHNLTDNITDDCNMLEISILQNEPCLMRMRFLHCFNLKNGTVRAEETHNITEDAIEYLGYFNPFQHLVKNYSLNRSAKFFLKEKLRQSNQHEPIPIIYFTLIGIIYIAFLLGMQFLYSYCISEKLIRLWKMIRRVKNINTIIV